MNKYNLTKNQLDGIYAVSKLQINYKGTVYNFNSLAGDTLILTNIDGEDLAIDLSEIKAILNSQLVDYTTSEQSIKSGYSFSNTSLDTSIFKNIKNNKQRGGRYNNNDDATSSVNPNMFRNVSMSETSDDLNNKQRGGKYNNNATTLLVNSNIFKNVNSSETSNQANKQIGGLLFSDNNTLSSTLNLSEFTNKNNVYGLQQGGNNKKVLSKKMLNDIGINSSSTSEFCE